MLLTIDTDNYKEGGFNMERSEFVERFHEIVKRAMIFCKIARNEGLLALEEMLDKEKLEKRDIFEYGLTFVIDGFDHNVIKDLMANIIRLEKDDMTAMLKKIQADAVLSLQSGENSFILLGRMCSHTDIYFTMKEIDKLREGE
jgi:flagellar motor component MotA